MNTKNIENKPMDGTKFLDVLSKISLAEILQLEFRYNPTIKWESLITPAYPIRKYNCNICRVVQFGDQNLFSHLSGKKHIAAMKLQEQLQIRTKPNGAPQKLVTEPTKKGPITNANNNKNSPSPVVKNSPIIKKNVPNQNSNANTNVVNQAAENEVAKTQPTQNKKPVIGVKTQSTPPKVVNNPNTQKNFQAGTPNIQKNVPGNNPPNQKNTSVNNTPVKKNTGNNTPVQKSIPIIGVNAQKRTNPNPGTIQAKKANVNAANANNIAIKKVPQSATPTAITSQKPGGPAPKTTVSTTTSQQAVNVQIEKQPLEETKPTVQNPSQTPSKPQPTKAVQNAKLNNADLARSKTDNPDIIKNPLSTKISCVPLAKLINSTPERENEVIIIDDLPKEATKPPETPKKPIPVQTSNPKPSIAAKKPINVVAHPVRPTINKVVKPSYVAPKDYTIARPGGTFESRKSHVMGLVGVEYVLKIVKNLTDNNARYQCCLCEITADEQSMHNHLLGYNHRLKYFDKHFPTAMRLYRQYVSHVPESEVCKIMMPIFDKLAHAIEAHHGRKSAHLCYEHVYSKDRQSLFTQVYNRKHSSEKIGPSFTHVVDAKEVEELIDKIRNNVQPFINVENPNPYYVPQYVPHAYVGYQNVPEKITTPPIDDETHKRMVDNFLRDTRHGSGDVQKSRNAKRNRSRSKSPDQRKRVAPKRHWNVERRSVSPLRDGDIWQAYRHMVDLRVRELNVSFDTYKSDPEQHPSYQAEWQMFWKRRKDELILAGINHRTYNFQNEWINFFNARIEELYNQDIENIKIKCRERLCLPMTNNELEDEKYHVHLDKTDEPDDERRQESIINNKPQKVSVDVEPPVEEPPNVIHVLRLLTALENYLGSLGPFVTEMLVKALQSQKIYPEKLHTLILTPENCAILETVKEKFTGLLISQIYDPAKERALKRAINDTDRLLQSASKLNNSNDKEEQLAEKPEMEIAKNLPHNLDKPLDKTELAAKLASSLVSQGKTSINREELQKILQVYTMIEQKKRQDMPSSTSSVNSGPSTSTNLIPNSNNNDNLLTQHSSRNLNNNPTSEYTGQNYSGNVARFNNQQSTNLASPFTSNTYPTDRGFGAPGGYNSQFGSKLPAINPSSVLRNDLTTSSLFNFNTNLNPSYNNLNRRNTNF
ncbi:uncharacterized protein LOC6729544 [Drosophila simulans]|uniref:GD18233 n=1 Tax=Drosophila simulans TaxID=7240 RepID=B4QUB8_DROSI|nr:uncharacterized protein LOC6729544 [Drosophila simulans]EDX14355.1 GD18233 [Drosophila simulans]KMZ05773.1 uncharacterized protein Dsimw501_GD18233 [Drosophila simulans]